MKYDAVMPVLTILFGSLCLFMWWSEMFSESRVARLWRSMTKPTLRGKNWSAICTPALSLALIDIGIMSIAKEGRIPYILYFPALYVALLLVLVILIGLLPIRFPRWVYADWQYAKRHGLLDEKGNIDQGAWACHHAQRRGDTWW